MPWYSLPSLKYAFLFLAFRIPHRRRECIIGESTYFAGNFVLERGKALKK
jgi:hypothetical protein